MLIRPLALAGLLLTGCAIDARDIDTWPGVAGGSQRLAGYALDTHRPPELRVRALTGLFRQGDLDHLMAVLDQATDRGPLVTAMAQLAVEQLGAQDEAVRWRALALGYLILESPDVLGEAGRRALAEAVAEKGLAWLAAEVKGPVAPEVAVLGAAVADPLAVVPRMVAAAEAAPSESAFLFHIDLLAELREPPVETRAAALLVARAQQAGPAISLPLALRLKGNGNETALLHLVRLVGDDRVAADVRLEGVNAASRLGPKAVPALIEALGTLKADDDYRWTALVAAWTYGGPDHLAATLRALPADGTWPTEGSALRDAMEGHCDNRLAEKSAQVRPTLETLLADPSWVARAFAMACVIRLYPADAPALLKPLRTDQTPLAGWGDGITTFAQAAKAAGG